MLDEVGAGGNDCSGYDSGCDVCKHGGIELDDRSRQRRCHRDITTERVEPVYHPGRVKFGGDGDVRPRARAIEEQPTSLN